MNRLVDGDTGATSSSVSFLTAETLMGPNVGGHMVRSMSAIQTIGRETIQTGQQLEALASVAHAASNRGASIFSDSLLTDGGVIVPHSVRTAQSSLTAHFTSWLDV